MTDNSDTEPFMRLEEPETFQLVPEHEGKLGRLLEGPTHSFPGFATIIQYFQSGLKSGKIKLKDTALKEEERKVSFEDLDALSSKLALAIKEELGPSYSNQNPDGDLVLGVCLPPSERLVILLFAILKIGGAYLPFDNSFPEDRVIRIVTVAKPIMVISEAMENTLAKFDPVKFKTKVLTIDSLWKKAEEIQLGPTDVDPLEEYPSPSETTALVLFTSGSTGEPKGVRLSHRVLMNRLNWQWHQFPFKSKDKCCFKTALTFVDSVPEIFGPLLQGRHIIIFPKSTVSQPHIFVNRIQEFQITRLTLVPSLLHTLLMMLEIVEEDPCSRKPLLATIKLWISSGEALTHDLLMLFFKHFPTGVTLCNFYGSTEIMGDVTYEVFQSEEDVHNKCIGDKEAHVPLGQPLYNTVIYVLSPKLEMVEEGEVGEIYVAGYNLCKGYVGVKDSDKFLFNPFSKTAGFHRLYRTGDFGHIDHMKDGRRALFFDGRVDSQIKVRGMRVDLSEVEVAVNELSIVQQGVVLCYHPGYPDQQIVAFIIPTKEEGTADRISFMLELKLINYQMPRIKIVERIPVLVNGKIDRQRLLKEFHEEMLQRTEFDNWDVLDIPQHAMTYYRTLIEIISFVTGTAIHDIVVDLDDSFYNLGGTSLNSLTIIAELKKKNYMITIHDFVTAKTIRELVSCMKPLHEGHTEDSSIAQDARSKVIPETLTDEHKECVTKIIASSFSHKGDLEAYLHVVYQDFVIMINSIWHSLVEKGLSFVVRRRSDREIVAVCLNFDVYDEPSHHVLSPGLEVIFDFLEHCEALQRERLPKEKGKILHSFMMGTHEELTEAENVYMIEFMEEETIRLGIFYNFQGIFSTNTSVLTQQIAKEIHGYEILSEVQINLYQDQKGNKPFALAPDTQTAMVVWKPIQA